MLSIHRDAFFILPLSPSQLQNRRNKLIKVQNGSGPFETAADKLLRTPGWHIDSEPPPAAVNAQFNLASNCLDSHCGRVWGGGRWENGLGLRLRPPPKAPRGSFHLREEIIRGCFVEGTLALNWIKARCRETVAFQAVAGSCFIIMINIFFFSFPRFSNQCSAQESAVSFGTPENHNGRF